MVRCSVLGCKSNSESKMPNLSFHSFPDDGNIRRNWIEATGRTNWSVKKSSKICSRHFETNLLVKKKSLTVLRPNAVPLLEIKTCLKSSSDSACVKENIETSVPSVVSLQIEETMDIDDDSSALKPDLETSIYNNTMSGEILKRLLNSSTKNCGKKQIHHHTLKNEFELPVESEEVECVVCMKRSYEHHYDHRVLLDYDIQTARTNASESSLRIFLSKYSKHYQILPPIAKYVCSLCLKLVNALDKAEIEYFKVKNEFDSIISKNPLFATQPVQVKSEVLSEGEEAVSEDDNTLKMDGNNIINDVSSGNFEMDTVIKIEPGTDTNDTQTEEKLGCGGQKRGKFKTYCQRNLQKGSPQQLDVNDERKTESDDNVPLESIVETVMADIKSQKNTKKRRLEPDKKKQDDPAIDIDTGTSEPNYEKQPTEHSPNGDTTEDFECNICFSRFTHSEQLTVHLGTHTDVKQHQCSVCLRCFKQKHSLQEHLRVHTGERPFECDICHRAFTQKQNLQAHLRTHTAEKPFACDMCERQFCSKNSLRSHALTHTGENPYQCMICHRHFSHKNNLENHLRTHTGEKPFKCHVCQRKFSQNNNLRSHLRLHSGEKPFKCSVCDRDFNRKNHLQEHLRTHTGEKPYECDVCETQFNSKYTLGRHYKNLHGILGGKDIELNK